MRNLRNYSRYENEMLQNYYLLLYLHREWKCVCHDLYYRYIVNVWTIYTYQKATFSIFIGSLCCTVNFVIILFFTCDVFLSQNDDILYMTDTISAHWIQAKQKQIKMWFTLGQFLQCLLHVEPLVLVEIKISNS